MNKEYIERSAAMNQCKAFSDERARIGKLPAADFEVPNFWMWLHCPHFFDIWRYVKCPVCGRKSWVKRVKK